MKIPKCRYFDGVFEKKLFGQKFSIFTYFLMIFRIFFYISRKTKILKIQKKSRFFGKKDQKSSFCVPVGLYHPVSENVGYAGHFSVFTTHTTLFFALFGSIEVAAQVCPKWWKSRCDFCRFWLMFKKLGRKM